MKNEIPKIVTDQFIIQYFYDKTNNKIIKIHEKYIPNEIKE